MNSVQFQMDGKLMLTARSLKKKKIIFASENIFDIDEFI